MNTIKVSIKDKIAIVTLERGRSNAINSEMIKELQLIITSVENDDQIGGLILAGTEGFFSAGLDLIELYDYDEHQIRAFWLSFLKLISSFTSFKKPSIAAITGHAPAGGCAISICCDYRIMADGKYIIGLNEIPLGIIIPYGVFHLYSFWLGEANSGRFLLEGKLMDPQEALKVGLVDEVVNANSILTAAERQMKKYIQLNWTTWQQSKLNIRKDLIEKVRTDSEETLEIMLKQWWSPNTRSILKTIIGNLQQKKG